MSFHITPTKPPAKHWLIILLLLVTWTMRAQEICDNGVDDDGDGLIDLQDDDCVCTSTVTGFRANFEERTCCPVSFTGNIIISPAFDCISDGWGAMGGGTTDYFNTCGYLGTNGVLPLIPLPIPSGEGAIGFITQNLAEPYLEGTANCLSCEMVPGNTYVVDFYMGFAVPTSDTDSPDLEVAIYGKTDCNNIPSSDLGCPLNYGWTEIVTFQVDAVPGGWVPVNGSFVAADNYTAIAFSASCAHLSASNNERQYHFMDDLRVAGEFSDNSCISNFDFTASRSGDCTAGYDLLVAPPRGSSVQWYRNGVALPGATGDNLSVDPSLPGDYQARAVLEDGNCSISVPLRIDASQDSFDLTAMVTDALCNESTDGSITPTLNNGNAPYSTRWSTGAMTPTLTAIGAGDYSVTITDVNGCIGVADARITEPEATRASVNIMQPSGTLGGSATVNGTNGIDPFQYTWSNGFTGPTQNGLASGTYTVTATDARGCMAEVDFEILQPLSAAVDIRSETCLFQCDGSATLIPLGGQGPYTYQWSVMGQNDVTLANLCPNSYVFTITDAIGTEYRQLVRIDAGSNLSADIGEQGTRCLGTDLASLQANATDGNAPLTYTWSTGATSATLTDVPPGTYSVTVADASDCRRVASTTVLPVTSLELTAAITDITCETPIGDIVVSTSGGRGPYRFRWNTGATVAALRGIPAGTYTLTVTDARGCEATENYTINPTSGLEAQAIITDNTCPGEAEGAIEVTTTGPSPVIYSWSDGSTTSSITGLEADTYSLTITDIEGCAYSFAYPVTEPVPFGIDSLVRRNECAGGRSASIELIPLGAGPYQASWSTGGAGLSLDNLMEGDYSVTVTNADGCAQNYSFTLEDSNEPLVITVDQTPPRCGADNGGLSLVPGGGVAPYNFTWADGATDAVRTGLGGGMYAYTVTDAVGCTLAGTNTLSDATSITVAPFVVPPTCRDAQNGRIELTLTGGTAPITVSWPDGSTGFTIDNLGPGTYSPTITDGEGCTVLRSYTLTTTSSLSWGAVVENVTCFGGGDGSITTNVVAGLNPVNYAWSNGENSSALTNVVTGDYALTVTDAAGCTYDTTFAIRQPERFTIDSRIVGNDCFGDNSASIQLTPPADGSTYLIRWGGGETSFSLTDLVAGSYSATITNEPGCEQVYSFNVIDENPPLMAERVLIQPNCFDDLARFTLTPSGGVGPYTFNGINSTTAFTFDLPAGPYDLPLADANGCSLDIWFVVSAPDTLRAAIISTTDTEPGASNGTITATASGGTAPLTFSWSNGMMGANINGLPAGTYVLTITDANGCQATATATIDDLPVISLMAVTTGNPCFDGCVGTIDLIARGGMPPYSVIWSDGQTQPLASGLCAGRYAATVTDTEGTVAVSEFYTITTPEELSATITTTPVTCLDANNGTLAATAFGGTMPYRYTWDGGAGGDSLGGLPAGRYELNLVDANGCAFTEVAAIDDYVLRDLTVSATVAACEGEAYNISVTGPGMDMVEYLLNGEPVRPNASGRFSALPPGNYTLAYLEATGCTVPLDTFQFDGLPPYEVFIDESPRELFFGETTKLELQSFPPDQVAGSGTVIWSALDNFTCLTDTIDNCNIIELSPSQSQTVSVSYRDTNGCQTDFRIPLVVAEPRYLYIPTAFSPNGDGVNDRFTVFTTDYVAAVQGVGIYDRWGSLVFEGRDLPSGELPLWDGDFRGKAALVGVYVYQFRLLLADGRQELVSGDFVLLR